MAAEGRVDDVLHGGAELAVIARRQRREERELLENRFTFHVEKIRGEKDEEEADQQSGDAANDVRAVARHPSRHLAHQWHDQPLRRELRGIERRREALDP